MSKPKRCPICNKPMRETRECFPYMFKGKTVVLINTKVNRCPSGEKTIITIPNIRGLHRTLNQERANPRLVGIGAQCILIYNEVTNRWE